MNRRKFILSGLLATISVGASALTNTPFKSTQNLGPVTEIDLRLYLDENLSASQKQDLFEYSKDASSSDLPLNELVKGDFINGHTLTIKGVVFSKAEISHLLFGV